MCKTISGQSHVHVWFPPEGEEWAHIIRFEGAHPQKQAAAIALAKQGADCFGAKATFQ